MKKIVLISVLAAGLWACKKENIGIKEDGEIKTDTFNGKEKITTDKQPICKDDEIRKTFLGTWKQKFYFTHDAMYEKNLQLTFTKDSVFIQRYDISSTLYYKISSSYQFTENNHLKIVSFKSEFEKIYPPAASFTFSKTGVFEYEIRSQDTLYIKCFLPAQKEINPEVTNEIFIKVK